MGVSIGRILSRALGRRATPAPATPAEFRVEPGSLTEKVETIYGAQYPRVFAIISWGLAASEWLCKVLNSHPDVLATHGLNYSVGQYLPPGPCLTESQVLRMVRDLGKGYALAGDVHGIAGVDNLGKIQAQFGDTFRHAVLTRDPERRALSFAGLFEQFGYDDRLWPGTEYVRGLPRFAEIAHHSGDKKKRFFMHAANMLNKVVVERLHPPMFRCEDLTTDPAALARLVDHLSAGRVTASPDWARAAVTTPRTNAHKKFGGSTGLQDWQAEILRAVVSPESCRAYEELGYRLNAAWSTAHLAAPRRGVAA
jgi:hypothetical protein